MKWSKFLFLAETKNKDILLFNTLTNGLVILKREKYDNFFNQKDYQESDEYKYLLENSFICSKEKDEHNQFYLDTLEEYDSNEKLNIHVVSTTGCNFKCIYCYQEGISVEALNNKNIQSHSTYIEKYVKEFKIKHVNLDISGGEPTINFPYVEKLIENLSLIFKKLDISYNVFIITNGYLLDKQKVDFLSRHNLDGIQITIDGLRNTHDYRRPLKNGGSSFDKIMENIKYIQDCDLLKYLTIRVNYDNQNIEEIPELLYYLKENINISDINLSFGLINHTVGDSKSNDFVDQYYIKEKDAIKSYLKLYKKAHELGYFVPNFYSYSSFCGAKNKHSFFITPNGEIGKCMSGVGRKDFIVGNVKDNNCELKTIFNWDNLKECVKKECLFLPKCYCGCLFEAYVKKGSTKEIDCRYNELREINKEILNIKYGEESVDN